MAERIAVYRYQVEVDGAPAEMRYTLAPVEGVGYAGRGTPAEADETGEQHATRARPAGHLEAPDGTQVVDVEPPTLEIPGQGRVDVSAVLGATEGDASDLGRYLRWIPA
jgi:hypothetical protein